MKIENLINDDIKNNENELMNKKEIASIWKNRIKTNKKIHINILVSILSIIGLYILLNTAIVSTLIASTKIILALLAFNLIATQIGITIKECLYIKRDIESTKIKRRLAKWQKENQYKEIKESITERKLNETLSNDETLELLQNNARSIFKNAFLTKDQVTYHLKSYIDIIREYMRSNKTNEDKIRALKRSKELDELILGIAKKNEEIYSGKAYDNSNNNNEINKTLYRR